MTDGRRAIPSMEKLLSAPEMQPLLNREPRARVAETLRTILATVRSNGAHAHDVAWYATQADERLQQMKRSTLQRVINATGVVLHTNLGRAPLSDAAIEAITATAGGFSNLEYDIDAGTRGSRYDHCTQLLRELTGAEGALVVNNNAAALVLALNTFAAGKEAVVSRGELVEIGGSFRIPEIMERSGARLREVGATNRTHVRDYEEALSSATGAVLKVHRSNFEMSGFVSEVSAAQLAATVKEHSAVCIHDLGSGLLEDLSDAGLSGEPTAREAVQAAPNAIITLSGDKLLGGPQAGILLGPSAHIAALKKNPMCRALRVDKLTISALAATLDAYARGRAREEVPVLRMLVMPVAEIERRAQALHAQLADAGVASIVRADHSSVGGGAFPGAALPTVLVLVDAAVPAQQLERALRTAEPPVIARIVEDRVAIDLRTVAPAEEPQLISAIAQNARA
jgi:L-seryl-tRNA(Ser) seleniumtransferase